MPDNIPTTVYEHPITGIKFDFPRGLEGNGFEHGTSNRVQRIERGWVVIRDEGVELHSDDGSIEDFETVDDAITCLNSFRSEYHARQARSRPAVDLIPFTDY